MATEVQEILPLTLDLPNGEGTVHDLIVPDLTAAEFFAGVGLVRMGLEASGWRVVFANDISEKKQRMYAGFYPDAERHYIVRDIFELPSRSVPASVLATSSFPCIDLSLAGNMNGMMSGRHSSAFWGFVKILEAKKDFSPPLVLVENVPGWLSSNGGTDFRATVQALNKLGYVCDVFALDALRFTPQSRLRIFLVGVKRPARNLGAEMMFTRAKSLFPDRLRKCVANNLDLQWMYNELPHPPPLWTAGLAAIVENLDESDDRWWTDNEVERHLEMMDAPHRGRVSRLVSGEEFHYRTFFRRRRGGRQVAEVRKDDLAGCLRTAVGGSGKQFLVRAGAGVIRMRAMTEREYARLQG
ncbi:MAG: DNA cytosine methyltransferase, partial [Blastocatellia bacterium]